jgi:hypothetical protein
MDESSLQMIENEWPWVTENAWSASLTPPPNAQVGKKRLVHVLAGAKPDIGIAKGGKPA